jgi:hypothetical protein
MLILIHNWLVTKNMAVNVKSRLLYLWKGDPILILEAEWAPGSVWTGAESLASICIRSPDQKNESNKNKKKFSPKTCCSATLFTTNPTHTYLQMNFNSLVGRKP